MKVAIIAIPVMQPQHRTAAALLLLPEKNPNVGENAETIEDPGDQNKTKVCP